MSQRLMEGDTFFREEDSDPMDLDKSPSDLYLGLPAVAVKLFLSMWIAFVLLPLNDMFRQHDDLWSVSAVLGLYVLVFLFLIWGNWSSNTRTQFIPVVLILTEAVLATFMNLQYRTNWMELFFFVGSTAGLRLSFRTALQFMSGVAVLAIGVGWVTHAGLVMMVMTVVVECGLCISMAGLVRTSATIKALREARQHIARLAASEAVAEERLRFARDLHDLLGHSLSLIALKSELAGRLTGLDPDRATKEIREVESVARDALREVRQAVHNYRQPTFAVELDGAKQMLEAAGIQYHIEYESGNFPPDVDSALAWTIREVVTNVIRHAHARFCEIHLHQEGGMLYVSVINDGVSGEQTAILRGNGLLGVAERVSSLNGTLEAGRYNHEFRVTVTIPTPLGKGAGH